MSGESKTTTNHDEIKQWAEERGGKPASVKGTGDNEPGILRFDFNEPEESLEQISWEDFFNKFEENNLAFLYQDETADGNKSRFFKFINR